LTDINEMLETIKTVRALSKTVATHEEIIDVLLNALDRVHKRLAALERPVSRKGK